MRPLIRHGYTGTGKSLTTVMIAGRLYLDGKIRRMLVVAPSSVCPVWPSEFRKFGAFPSRVAVLQGDKSKRLAALKYIESPAIPGTHDPLRVAVINYESTWRLEDELKAYDADLIVCDESQRMLREKTILICDICGFATDPKPMFSFPRNDAASYLPSGWCKGDTRNIDICPACAKVRRGVTLDFKTRRFARSRCPFCGDLVSVETVLDGLLFTCLNVRHCGATIRFENDHYAECMEDAAAAFDRRSGAQKEGGNDHDQ